MFLIFTELIKKNHTTLHQSGEAKLKWLRTHFLWNVNNVFLKYIWRVSSPWIAKMSGKTYFESQIISNCGDNLPSDQEVRVDLEKKSHGQNEEKTKGEQMKYAGARPKVYTTDNGTRIPTVNDPSTVNYTARPSVQTGDLVLTQRGNYSKANKDAPSSTQSHTPRDYQQNIEVPNPSNVLQATESTQVSFQPGAEIQNHSSGNQVGEDPIRSLAVPEEERRLSVLILTVWWMFDKQGLSTLTRSIVNNLRTDLDDREGQNIKITCAVLQEEGKISEIELKDAQKHGVTLRGARQSMGEREQPKLEWLDKFIATHYAHVIQEDTFDFIIGHAPFTANGAFNLAKLASHKGQSPKVILVVHGLPTNDLNDQFIISWLTKAHVVFSVGPNMWTKLDSFIKSNELNTEHKLYIPGLHSEFFKIRQQEETKELSGEQNILVIAPNRETLGICGLDFELAVVSSALASQNILAKEGRDLTKQLSFNLNVIAPSDKDKAWWEDRFNILKDKHGIDGIAVNFRSPQKPDCSQFCTESLVAMAAGKPDLVSKTTGVATVLQNLGFEEPIVWDGEGFSKDVKIWGQELIKKMANTQNQIKNAEIIKRVFCQSVKINTTHWDLIRSITS